MLKISCFGASVTQQAKGYVFYLEQLFKSKINAHGFGSEHLCYSGVIHINKVLNFKPEICFIDWFSTGNLKINENNTMMLDTIKYKFATNNCKIIFLFFPLKETGERIDYYNFLKKYLNDNNLSYIDLNTYISYDEKMTRDGVHTTEYGAEIYANTIFNEFNKMTIKLPINIHENKYCNVKELCINQIFNENLILKGNCQVLALGLKIGPNSGYIRINNELCLLWDPYCHYERKIKRCNFDINNICEIKVLDKEVDYSSCRREYNFENVRFELNIENIYYIGDSLEFINGN